PGSAPSRATTWTMPPSTCSTRIASTAAPARPNASSHAPTRSARAAPRATRPGAGRSTTRPSRGSPSSKTTGPCWSRRPPAGRTAVYNAAQLGATGMQAAESLGIVNVIGVLTRAWQAWRHDPVSNQAIIDRGEELLAREPNSPQAADVHARLADAYERAGNYGRALMHYQATPNPSPKRIAALEDKLADRMLEDAGRTGPGNRTLLEAIVSHLGETKA